MLLTLKVVHIIVCIVLITGVLLQSGKSAGLGAIEGGASSVFGDEGRQLDQILSKVTTAAAILFMLLSLGIAYLQ